MDLSHRVASTVVLGVMLALLAGGCASGSSALNPNSDKDLRKKQTSFYADAITRSYPADAPRAGTAPMRAEVDYFLKVINSVNFADKPWTDVEVWVNGQYVCHLTHLPVKKQETINFRYLFDKGGMPAPSSGVWIKTLEVKYNGSLYTIPLFAAD